MAQFTVKYKDKLKNTVHEMNVDGNDITTQQEAEEHVRSRPKARGGTHPGLEVVPSTAPAAADETKDASE